MADTFTYRREPISTVNGVAAMPVSTRSGFTVTEAFFVAGRPFESLTDTEMLNTPVSDGVQVSTETFAVVQPGGSAV